eukprot:3403168-Rhodomonas_salina.6
MPRRCPVLTYGSARCISAVLRARCTVCSTGVHLTRACPSCPALLRRDVRHGHARAACDMRY